MFLADTINTVTIILVECRHNLIMFLAIRFLEVVGMAIKGGIMVVVDTMVVQRILTATPLGLFWVLH
jgi:hypothetical protein